MPYLLRYLTHLRPVRRFYPVSWVPPGIRPASTCLTFPLPYLLSVHHPDCFRPFARLPDGVLTTLTGNRHVVLSSRKFLSQTIHPKASPRPHSTLLILGSASLSPCLSFSVALNPSTSSALSEKKSPRPAQTMVPIPT